MTATAPRFLLSGSASRGKPKPKEPTSAAMMNKLTVTTCVTLACAFTFASNLQAKDEKVKLGDCPPAVQKAIQDKAAGGEIKKVEKGTEEKGTVYEAEIKTTDGKEIEIAVTPEGKLVKTELKVKLTECPAAVQKAITEKSAGGTIKEVEKVVASGGKVTYTAEIKPAKGDTMELKVTEEGKVLKFEVDKD
jgi:uncharacterized membrane protein YkoI